MASRNLNDLCPELRDKCIEWQQKAHEMGIDVLVYCTWRSPAEQLAAVKAGKSGRKKGPHNYVDANGAPASKAFDFCVLQNGKICWDDNIDTNHDHYSDYKQLGELGESLGLVWGGRWKKPHDPDHLQIKGA